MAMTILLQQSSCAAIDTFGRSQPSQVHPRIISQLKYDLSSVSKHKLLPLRHLNSGFILQTRRNRWKFRILGTIVTILLSFFKGKWGLLLLLKEKVETTIDELEEISDVVEEVADKVEEVAEAVAKHLPDGKLQDAAEFIDKLAEEIENDARLAGDLLEKVEEIMENKVDSFLDSNTPKEQTVISE